VKPDGTPWVCTFDDEFDASTGDANSLNLSKWTPQVTATSAYTTGPTTSPACYLNSPNNISVANGYLSLTARKLAAPTNCGWFSTQYTAGMVSTVSGFQQTYGRFEVRAKLPQTTAKGLQETLWLWPTNATKYGAWPGSGEIDFAEFYSQYADREIPYIHYNYNPATVNAATNTNIVTNYTSCMIDYTAFNDYAVEWQPGTITLSYNGKTCLVDHYVATGLTGAQPFDQPFFLALTQALGVGANAFDPATTPLPATTEVDYVRVWK
jgi:beta-glucanase (GH16 family)